MIKSHRNCISIGLLTSHILLSIICLVHLFAMLTYLLRGELSPYLFPASVLTAIASVFLLVGKFNIYKKTVLIASSLSLLVLVVSLSFAWFYFDLSWDGQWYHQAAVYNLGGKWNPILQPLETPDHVNNSSILYFPKSSWLFGAAILRLFGTVEMGKAYNMLLPFAAFSIVYTFCREVKMGVLLSIAFTLLVIVNPVVWSEFTTYLNDGDLYLFLVMYIALVILWLRDPKPIFMVSGAMAAICLVNVKFTGLVFFLMSAFFLFIYVLIKNRKRIKPFLLSHLLTGFLAVGIFGYNPYVTNMINRGNPLYPLVGSTAFPSVFANGKDDNEKYETPQNMRGQSILLRLILANFSQPGNAPYNKERNAVLANPVATSPAKWKAYQYHETRVGGFGPYFGIALILTLVVIPILLFVSNKYQLPILVFFVGLCCCLALSKHFWWPRFFPMLWLAPLLPLFIIWMPGIESAVKSEGKHWMLKALKTYALVLAVTMFANGLIVACVHMQWETASSVVLRTQLENLSMQQQPIEVDYGKFKGSIEPKLNYWHIKFTPAKLKHAKDAHKLMSVVKGYPNTVLYRMKADSLTK